MIGWVTMAMVVAPMVAPLVGGALDTALGWQAIFGFIALVCAATLVGAAAALPETQIVPMTSGGFVRFLDDAHLLLRAPQFVGYALCAATSSAIFFAFLGGAPHVVVSMMGRSSAVYGVWFAFTSVGYMAGNFFAARWSPRFGVDRMIWWGALTTLIGALCTIGAVVMLADGGP